MNNRVNDLSSTVKQLRKEAGITQEQLAEYSGVWSCSGEEDRTGWDHNEG